MQKKNKIGLILGFIFLMGTSCFTKSMNVIAIRHNYLQAEVDSTQEPRKLLKKIIYKEKELISSSKVLKIIGLSVVGGGCLLCPEFPTEALMVMMVGGTGMFLGFLCDKMKHNKSTLDFYKKQLRHKIKTNGKFKES